ncbi:MAG TPA: MFS transporter, partial [Alphaproteobacteria bacterium]
MAETRKRGGIVAALSDRNYRIYCAGSTVSLVGMWIQRVAVAWLAWTLTESATWLGILALADLAPSMLFAPFAGALADRIDRLRMIWATQVAQMIQALALIGLTVADAIDIWWLLALTFVLGIATAFNAAARLAILPTLVPDSVFP